MDIKMLDVFIKSSYLVKVPIIVACMLVTGCASQPATLVSGAPADALTELQPVVTQDPSSPAPASEMTAEPAKSKLVARKPKPKKRKKVAKTEEAVKTEKVAKTENAVKAEKVAKAEKAVKPKKVAKPKRVAKLEAQDTSRKILPQPQDVLLQPAHPPVEHAPVVPPPVTPAAAVPSSVTYAPIPAHVESVAVAPAKPEPAPNVVVLKYNDLVTAVLRGDREATKELLDLGWWVDKPSEDGVTPLMAAVMNRDTQMVQMLLEHGAEPSVHALSLARKNKDAATASLLEKR